MGPTRDGLAAGALRRGAGAVALAGLVGTGFAGAAGSAAAPLCPAGGAASRAGAASGPSQRSAPCEVSDGEPCTVRLRGPGAPAASPGCLAEPWSRFLNFTLPGRWEDSNQDGWWEAVLAIALDPIRECACARLIVHFEDPVHEWAVDIGDSPTANGYGGDDGTTPQTAEVQVHGRSLAVFSGILPESGTIEALQQIDLPPLGGRRVEFVICDQSLQIDLPPPAGAGEPLRLKLVTPRTRLLFALTDPGQSAPAGGRGNDHAIYAAFNRVIHARGGAADQQRRGTGVSRVEIALVR